MGRVQDALGLLRAVFGIDANQGRLGPLAGAGDPCGKLHRVAGFQGQRFRIAGVDLEFLRLRRRGFRFRRGLLHAAVAYHDHVGQNEPQRLALHDSLPHDFGIRRTVHAYGDADALRLPEGRNLALRLRLFQRLQFNPSERPKIGNQKLHLIRAAGGEPLAVGHIGNRVLPQHLIDVIVPHRQAHGTVRPAADGRVVASGADLNRYQFHVAGHGVTRRPRFGRQEAPDAAGPPDRAVAGEVCGQEIGGRQAQVPQGHKVHTRDLRNLPQREVQRQDLTGFDGGIAHIGEVDIPASVFLLQRRGGAEIHRHRQIVLPWGERLCRRVSAHLEQHLLGI